MIPKPGSHSVAPGFPEVRADGRTPTPPFG